MPIEIRELVIRTTVVQENATNAGAGNSNANNGITANDEIVTLCVEKILEIIKEQNGR